MDDASSESTSGIDRKIMLFTFVTAISIVLFFVWYNYSYFRLRRRFAATPTESRGAEVDLPVFRPRGLAPSQIKLIPTFRYSGGPLLQVIDCAVCLSEFEDGETGRILPDCRHCFHKDCIDEWFRSHSNCPLCRAPVSPEIRESDPGRVVITVGDGGVGGSDPGMGECGCSVTAEALMVHSEYRRKPPESVSEPPLWCNPITEADLVSQVYIMYRN